MDSTEIDGTKADLENAMTLADLVHVYQTDRISTYHQLRYHTRQNTASILKRLVAAHGPVELKAIKRRDLTEWYMDWSADGKVSMAHAFMAQLRTMTSFGASMFEDDKRERGFEMSVHCCPSHPCPICHSYSAWPWNVPQVPTFIAGGTGGRDLSSFTDQEIAAEYYRRAQQKLGDPRTSVGFPVDGQGALR